MDINAVCKNILEITEEDFAKMEKIAVGQKQYVSPLRMATQGRQNELGEHNLKVLNSLRELQTLIQSGANI